MENIKNRFYDVIIVGGGHAGCEAALSSARIGARTLMISMNLDHIAQMSCNPAIGGIAKGHVVREIDALGGEMGHNTDATSIQFRMLNQTKGPAVWSPRSQCDRVLYQYRMKDRLEKTTNLDLLQAEVVDLVLDAGKDQITAVKTNLDEIIETKSVVICSGTFLRGLLYYGMKSFSGGRSGDFASNDLADILKDKIGLEIGRLKTGTPPRILAESIDFSKLERQEHVHRSEFSFDQGEQGDFGLRATELPQLACYIGRTTPETAEIVRDNLHKSPMYSGRFEGIGARYCPSFEDKVVRFAHHDSHQLFVEPEGIGTSEFYINGISTSLPFDVQWQMIRSISGFENAVMARYAYAIEYDFVFPHQLSSTLAVKCCLNLFLAGQINGTSGYEEAAGQGLVAGINAAHLVQGKEKFVLRRDQAYIGVMIDDLITKDIIEPYRLFTSRSEYRLSLRQDNADIRLTAIGHELGLVSTERWERFQRYVSQLNRERSRLQKERSEGKSSWDRLRISGDYSYGDETVDDRVVEELTIEARYEGYMERERRQVEKLSQLESWNIPDDFDYSALTGLKNESRQKLSKTLPDTLAQASRIDGVTPAEIGLLQVALRKK